MCFCLLRKQFSLYMHLRGELNYSRPLFSSNSTLLESHLQSLSLDLGTLVNISMTNMKILYLHCYKKTFTTVVRCLCPPPLHLPKQCWRLVFTFNTRLQHDARGTWTEESVPRLLTNIVGLIEQNLMKCGRMESPFIVISIYRIGILLCWEVGKGTKKDVTLYFRDWKLSLAFFGV